MKSPWKFLVELTSPRKTTDARQDADQNDADVRAVGLGPTPVEANNEKNASGDRLDTGDEKSNTAPDGTREDPGQKESPSPHQPVTGRAGEMAAASGPPTIDRVETRQAQPKHTQQAGKAKGHVSRKAVRNLAPILGGEQPQAPSPQSFVQEMTMLDEEIMDLRRQLSQKLHRQNVQLKTMLERFNQS